ncbi:hypothetical protein ABN763_09775 [Spongiivirga sp. MCCC 1A20706]|uniref:hypothetical protein n=1 Tax=Spongiivirga sp. MCCC 1A20706 TaxID=3160963 RepID=UPI003977702C
MKKAILVLFALFVGFPLIGQTLNKYKYVVIPKRFDFVKKDDQYFTSTLTRHLFKQKGFEVFYDDEILPESYIKDPCKGLQVSVDNLSGLLTTRMVISLKNCYKEQVFVSQEGKSKEKNYKKAYHEAIKQAFQSVEFLSYTYEEPKKEELKVVVDEKAPDVTTPVTIVEDNGPFEEIEVQPKSETGKKDIVKVTKSDNNTTSKTKFAFNGDVLYAQTIDGGYQLVNSTPKIVAKIFKTSDKNSFLIDSDLYKGLLKKVENKWFVEVVENGKVVKAQVKIKF